MIRSTWALAAMALLLAACSDRPQTATTRKVDDKPWDSTQTQHMVSGFKAGDRAGWEQQLKTRAQNQNEYSRTTDKR